jgi:hypothetical protein
MPVETSITYTHPHPSSTSIPSCPSSDVRNIDTISPHPRS